MMIGMQSGIVTLAVVVGHTAVGRIVRIVERIELIGQQRSGGRFG